MEYHTAIKNEKDIYKCMHFLNILIKKIKEQKYINYMLHFV